MTKSAQTILYTDGACIGNPGPGGYGVVLLRGTERVELARGFRRTTNNRMEILAAIVGIEALDAGTVVTVHSDSRLLVDGITKGWAARWRKNGWMRNKNERALNPDLWERLIVACAPRKVEFRWVKGHAGNRENERCDVLANDAARGCDLIDDLGYGAPAPTGSLFTCSGALRPRRARRACARPIR